MKILIDMTHISMSKIHASTSVYVFRILDTMLNSQNDNTYVLLIHTEIENYIKERYPKFEYITFPYTSDHLISRKKGLSKFIFQTIQYQKHINKSQCDGLLIANDLHLYTCISKCRKKITVIHDLKALKDRTRLEKKFYYIYYALSLLTSSKIIAISEFTKQDILRNYSKLFKNKIKVIYNSIQLSDKITRPSLLPPNTNYILYVNTLQEYKNIKTLLKALSLIENLNHQLVVVGKSTPYWMNQMIPYIEEKNLTDKIIHIEHVTEEELHFLYKHASLFVSCSLREGFGYTPIEAAICKCPVICSTCESLPETTLNKLEYYSPPYNAQELSRKITEVLSSPPTLSSRTKISNLFKEKYSPITQCQKICNLFNQ